MASVWLDEGQVLKTKTSQDERILAIIEPIAEDLGYRVVRVRLQGGNRPTLQIMAERQADHGMSVDDCATLSREISSTLEVEDPIIDSYILEVSSPGLERPLTRIEDFETYRDYLARLDLDRLVEGRKRFRGVLAGVDGDQVMIDLDNDDQTALIPFAWISDAKLLITDERLKREQAEIQRQKQSTNSSRQPKASPA